MTTVDILGAISHSKHTGLARTASRMTGNEASMSTCPY